MVYGQTILQESYFRWKPNRYEQWGRGPHNKFQHIAILEWINVKDNHQNQCLTHDQKDPRCYSETIQEMKYSLIRSNMIL